MTNKYTLIIGTFRLAPRMSIRVIESDEIVNDSLEACNASCTQDKQLKFIIHFLGGGSLASAQALRNQLDEQLTLACSNHEIAFYRRIRDEPPLQYFVRSGYTQIVDPINQYLCEHDLSVELTLTLKQDLSRVSPYVVRVAIPQVEVSLPNNLAVNPLSVAIGFPSMEPLLAVAVNPLVISDTEPSVGIGQGQPTVPVTLSYPIPIVDIGGDPLAGVINEFYWPPPLRAADAIDLDAAAQWWRKVVTPSTAPTYTTATAEGVASTYGEEVLKCVAAASGDGLKSTWTYANEKRVKSGRYFALLVGVYVVTASRTATVELVSSTPTTIVSGNSGGTVGSWVTVALDPGTTVLDGASVDIRVTLDGAGTFYVVPLGAYITNQSSPTAIALAPRQQIFKWADPSTLLTLTGKGDEATWTDIDATTPTSPLTTLVQLLIGMFDSASTYRLFLRRNGSSDGNTADDPNETITVTASSALPHTGITVPVDDAQIFEYFLDRTGGAATLVFGKINLAGYYEWE